MQLQGTIYIDSIFLLNLVMDLYLLLLTVRILGKTATCPRILAGSAVGAAGYCIILCLPGIPYMLKVLFGMIPVGGLMIKIVCRTKGFRELFRAAGHLFTLSFFLGGFILFLKERCSLTAEYMDRTAAILGAGFVGYAICRGLVENCQKRRRNHFCRVSLPGDEGAVEFAALIDTGNGLVEPVSRKPVAILEEEQWKGLRMWMKPEKYKIIPYHSIGRASGVMEGYEIETMKVKKDETEKEYSKVIVAVFNGKISGKGSYQMILPPELSV